MRFKELQHHEKVLGNSYHDKYVVTKKLYLLFLMSGLVLQPIEELSRFFFFKYNNHYKGDVCVKDKQELFEIKDFILQCQPLTYYMNYIQQ
jgi:hypothetical protein